MTRTIFRSFLFAYALCCAGAACGGGYPERPVRLIIPFPPGGASDFGGRLVAAGLTDILGQQFVVDNRGGAIRPHRHRNRGPLAAGRLHAPRRQRQHDRDQPVHPADEGGPAEGSRRDRAGVEYSHRDLRPQQRGGEHAEGIPR